MSVLPKGMFPWVSFYVLLSLVLLVAVPFLAWLLYGILEATQAEDDRAGSPASSGLERSQPESQLQLPSNQLTIDRASLPAEGGPYQSVYRSTGLSSMEGLPDDSKPRLPSYQEALNMYYV